MVTRKPRLLSKRPSEEAAMTLAQGTRHPTGDEDVASANAPPLGVDHVTALGGSTGWPTHPIAAAPARRGSLFWWQVGRVQRLAKVELALKDVLKVPLAEGDQQGVPRSPRRQCRVWPGWRVAVIQAVDDQVGRLTGDRRDGDPVLGVQHQRAVKQHVRGHRGENLHSGPGRHDRSPSGQVVGGRAGRRGHDERVGGKGQKRGWSLTSTSARTSVAAGRTLQNQIVEGALRCRTSRPASPASRVRSRR